MTAGSPKSESPERQAFRGRAAALGLSTVHICSEQPAGTLRLCVGGEHVQLGGDPDVGGPVGGERGAVRVFSKASRRRLLRFLHMIDRERSGTPLFVTLTYPREWPGDPRRWKRDLHAWLDRLRRSMPGVWCVWRLEPQRRGAPHYHLLLFGVARLSIDWLSLTWYQVVGSGDERHLRAGTQVQQVDSWRRVIRYAAKYLAKETSDLPVGWQGGVGRWWGVHQRRIAPREVMQVQLADVEFFRVRRVLRRLVGGPGMRGRDCLADGRRGAGELVRRGQCAGLSAETSVRLVAWARSWPAPSLRGESREASYVPRHPPGTRIEREREQPDPGSSGGGA